MGSGAWQYLFVFGLPLTVCLGEGVKGRMDTQWHMAGLGGRPALLAASATPSRTTEP